MAHPYQLQPPKAFWRKAVSAHHPLDISDWYERRFNIDGARIATAGSCFAQHIGRALRDKGFGFQDAEPAPPGLPEDQRTNYGYGLYSARYGNIYTSRQLLQLVHRALGQFIPQEDVWEKDGGVVDPFRPTMEPEPFGSVSEMVMLRKDHLECVAALLRQTDILVFTLGLTEAWLSREDGAAFPLCPGTAGGTFDPARHIFHNLRASEVRADMETVLQAIKKINPSARLLLTVSPVPLMATATNTHVAVASSHSKAVLRSVAGELAMDHPEVDYFPSYEIITAPFMKGFFFQPDEREVSHHGVAHVMNVFFDQHPPPPPARPMPATVETPGEMERVKCDEELLNAFSER